MDEENVLKQRVWLNCICEHSPKLIDACVKEVGSAEEIYRGDIKEKPLRKILGYRFDDGYKRRDLSEADDIIRYCRESGIRIIHISDKDYPDRLRNTDMPPQILYAAGRTLNLNEYLCFSIVGSRRTTDELRDYTRKISYDISRAGIITVSGMALGIDSEVHIGALNAGQATVAVLAGGVDVVYPPGNKGLYDEILKHGMILSERPPGTSSSGELYQERNRIIAGISVGTLITEGRVRSGTSITAKYASVYDRDIFAVPGRPSDKNSYVPNALIRDGAVVTLGADDILLEYSGRYGKYLENGAVGLSEMSPDDIVSEYGGDFGYAVPKVEEMKKTKNRKLRQGRKKKKKLSKNEELSDTTERLPNFEKCNDTERIILEYLYKFDEPVHIDEITRYTGLGASSINSTLTLMLIKGYVKEYPGSMFMIYG